MRRRGFNGGLGSTVAWPVAARAQQSALPVVGFLNGGSTDAPAGPLVAFRKALNDTGFVEGQNVTIEYYWFEGQYGKLPAITADLVRRRVTVIATFGNTVASILASAVEQWSISGRRVKSGAGRLGLLLYAF
jgi:putative ABC transport system substrate-binding protein